ncbi:MAG: sigma 54-interacting transcriptional regulator [Nitrospira sp.]|nr:sigma 54-interacting transcriptional regulator [Nitrospira sp.]
MSSPDLEEALRRSEEFSSRLIESSRDCIKVLDLEGRLLSMNAGGMAALEICDLGPILGTSWIDFWEGNDRVKAQAAVAAALAGGVGRFVGFCPTTQTKQPRWWDVVINAILGSDGNPERLLDISRDVTYQAQHLAETSTVLQEIVEGVEAKVGERFFPSLVRQLATTLGVDYAYISELSEDGDRFRSKAGWGKDQALPPFEVPAHGPCETVLTRKFVHHPDQLRALYPHVQLIQDIGVESYCGVPIVDASDRVIGHLAIMDGKPMPDHVRAMSLLGIFATRAGAEFERLRLEQALRKSDLTLRKIDEGTATAVGEQFFRSLTKNLAAALGVRYVFATEMTEPARRVRTLAFWAGEGFADNFEYQLNGTPCQLVFRGEIRHFERDVQSLFPDDPDLVRLGAQGYVAVPLMSPNGKVLGNLAAIDDKPMPLTADDLSIFKIFGSRAGAELDRMQLEEAIRRSDLILRKIDEGTAAATGADFFRSLVQNLAEALQMKYAFVSKFVPGASLRVVTLAFWKGDGFLDNFEYDVPHTPCEEVLSGKTCLFPNRVQDLFPHHREQLAELGVESYLAIPVTDRAGAVMGHLAVMDTKPMQDDPRVFSLFKIFGVRAGAELERARLEAQIKESEERFRDLFDEAPIAYVNEGLDSKFIRANKTAMKSLGITPDQVEGTYGKSFAPDTPDAQRRLKEAFASIGKGIDTSGVVLELRRKDNGNPLWIQWWSRPDPSGAYTRTMFVDITERVLMEQEKARLEAQNVYLQEEIKGTHNFEELIGGSTSLKKVLKNVERVAPTDSTVLITGETGTGKELIARAIHNLSQRKTKPLVKVNCAAIPAGLIESELFGHEKGAFTGALTKKMGRFELADKGTIFLDEIGELPLDLQSKLLRVLQEGEFERVGGTQTFKVNVRVIAATNRNLEQQSKTGHYRPDLYYRLNVFPIHLPALRERESDIPLLAQFFARKFAANLGKKITKIPERMMTALQRYQWPGNIRELEHVIERAVILSEGSELEPIEWLTPSTGKPGNGKALTLEEMERQHIVDVLEQTNWRVSGEKGAAKILGLNPTTLEARLKKLGIERVKRET